MLSCRSRIYPTPSLQGTARGVRFRHIASPGRSRYGPAEQGLSAMARAPDETHFGDRQVPLGDKQALVDDVCSSVATRYDLMNDLMSGGLHRAWKDALVTTVNPPKTGRPFAALDIAGGTGDIAFRIAAAGGSGTRL